MGRIEQALGRDRRGNHISRIIVAVVVEAESVSNSMLFPAELLIHEADSIWSSKGTSLY